MLQIVSKRKFLIKLPLSQELPYLTLVLPRHFFNIDYQGGVNMTPSGIRYKAPNINGAPGVSYRSPLTIATK